jgi:hypothetical protein
MVSLSNHEVGNASGNTTSSFDGLRMRSTDEIELRAAGGFRWRGWF